MPEKPICQVCKMPKPYMYTIRNGFRICPRCVAAVAKNASDGLQHRTTFQYVTTSLNELAESVQRGFDSIKESHLALAKRVEFLERHRGVTPPRMNRAQTVRGLLEENPALTPTEIQKQTGIKADTIRKIMSRLKRMFTLSGHALPGAK